MCTLKFNLCGAEYNPDGGCFDEIANASKDNSSAAGEFLRRLEALDGKEFERRRLRLFNALNANDLTLSEAGHLHSETKRTDALPLIIPAAEWRELERGLEQRARLFNAIAEDMYGEQNLWKKGILPAELLYANPDFLPVAWKVKPARGIFVHLMGSDVLRAEDGKFRVFQNHLQVPDGLGLALENRIGVSRAFPELFRQLRTERLAGFFKDFLDTLTSLKADSEKISGKDGLVVMLASPPDSKRRNEDAILARYLGLPLVENDDLAIRQMHAYIKTLSGLKKIGAIFRRSEDSSCDPLELRMDTGEGAVGLISTVRAGNASMANFLGTGALESPLFNPFLSKLSGELLGEELSLPSVETIWLSDAGNRERLFDEPEKWTVRKIFGSGIAKAYRDLTVAGKLALSKAVQKNPGNYVAEAAVERSSAPVFQNGKWLPAKVSMRFFSINTPNGPKAMPGGFGTFEIRESPESGSSCGEKDIWVLSENPVAAFSLFAPEGTLISPSRAGGDLPSRAAENLYRLGRKLSAVHSMARIARSAAIRLSDESWMEMPELKSLLSAAKSEGGDPENALRSFVLRKDNSAGLQTPLKEIRDLAVQIRDRVSDEFWDYLNAFGKSGMPDGMGAAALLPYLNKILSDDAAVAGLSSESMTRGHEWRFLEIGRRIENGLRVFQFLQATLFEIPRAESAKLRLLQAVLEVGDGTMTYHRRYGGRLQTVPILDLLLCDESNPRSAAYQVNRLVEEAKCLPGESGPDSVFSPLERTLLSLQTKLLLADAGTLSSASECRLENLNLFASECRASLERIAGLIERHYLSHAPRSGIVHALATEV